MSKELLDKWSDSISVNHFPNHIGIVIDDIELMGAKAHVDLAPESMNAIGIAHGGVSFTLADTCAAYASRGDGREYVTQQANFYYLKANKGNRINAVATVVSRTKSLCVVEVDVFDESNTLTNKGTFNYFCVSKKDS